MDEVMVVLLLLVFLSLAGLGWDIARVVSRADFRGLSIAALVMRVAGPVAGYVAFATYHSLGNKFGALSAMARGVAWTLPFLVGALVLDLVLIIALIAARRSR